MLSSSTHTIFPQQK